MRWLVVALGAAALLLAAYAIVRPRWTRPVLYLSVGVRVEVLGELPTFHPPAQAWIPGLTRLPPVFADPDGRTLLPAGQAAEAAAIGRWMRARGWTRLAVPELPPRIRVLKRGRVQWTEDNSNSSYAALGLRATLTDFLWNRSDLDLLDPAPLPLGALVSVPTAVERLLEVRPDLVVLDAPGLLPEVVDALRGVCFDPPLVMSTGTFVRAFHEDPQRFDGCTVVLSPVKPPPPRFPGTSFAYAGHRAMLRMLDALDARPDVDPVQVVRELGDVDPFDLLREPPRLYQIRGGRLVEEPDK
jgi:hypothetical protein